MGVQLREWQQEAYLQYKNLNKVDFLCVATPGAGKTLWAGYIAKDLMDSRIVDRVIVVCPTEHLKVQWADKLHEKLGISIYPKWQAESDLPNFNGVSLTYQGVASAALVLRRICSKYRTVVILDEIHHAGESRSWGDALIEAFGNATRRICISGTPFRSDSSPIPFISYGQDGKSKADFTYGYSEALIDGVCRPIYFPAYDGEFEWFSRSGDVVTATFEDEINQDIVNERLNTAIDPSQDWLSEVIKEAHEQLQAARRNGHRRAKGLLIARDTYHAEQCARLLERITHVPAVIATSSYDDASERIEAFSGNDSMWIVAVNMVSEGVDIPDLRVGIYATNVTTELFFRQVVGRFVRMLPGLDEQLSHLYIPSDQRLKQFAFEIKREIEHWINDEEANTEPSTNEFSSPRQPGLFMPISAEARVSFGIFDGDEIPSDLLDMARQLGADALGISIQSAALLIKRMQAQNVTAAPQTPAQEHKTASWRDKDNMANRCEAMARKVASALMARNGVTDFKRIGVYIAQVHTEWLQQGGTNHKKASAEQLNQKLIWLNRRLQELQR